MDTPLWLDTSLHPLDPVVSHLFRKHTNSSQSQQQFDHWGIKLFLVPDSQSKLEYSFVRNLLAFQTSQQGMVEDPVTPKVWDFLHFIADRFFSEG